MNDQGLSADPKRWAVGERQFKRASHQAALQRTACDAGSWCVLLSDVLPLPPPDICRPLTPPPRFVQGILRCKKLRSRPGSASNALLAPQRWRLNAELAERSRRIKSTTSAQKDCR